MQTIEAEKTVTADTSDILGGTVLRSMPGPGAVAVYLASTVADSEATVSIGGFTLKTKGIISKVIANAQIDLSADSPLMTQVRGGEVLIVDVDVVSAATVRVKAIWMGELR